MPQLEITIGYLDVNGKQNAACISPSLTATSEHLSTQIVSEVTHLGITPVWATSATGWLATLAATRLNVSKGEPAGWGIPPVVEESELGII